MVFQAQETFGFTYERKNFLVANLETSISHFKMFRKTHGFHFILSRFIKTLLCFSMHYGTTIWIIWVDSMVNCA